MSFALAFYHFYALAHIVANLNLFCQVPPAENFSIFYNPFITTAIKQKNRRNEVFEYQ
jgi:hypothetical protein